MSSSDKSTHLLRSGELTLTVAPELAGRVLSFSAYGQELLTGPEVNPANFGTTYWTSPQSTWGWPPVGGIDHQPFELVSALPLVLQGRPADVGESRLSLRKTFLPLKRGSGFELRCEISNEGDAATQVAGWQISRVAPKGITFFATGDAELTPVFPHGSLPVKKEADFSFYDHQDFELGQSLKLHADGKEGFLAHLARHPAGPVLWVKVFEDSPASHQAPGEGEVEIFANEDGAYVEVEVQSPLFHLAPGETGCFVTRWMAIRVADALVHDSSALIALARTVAQNTRRAEVEGGS